MVKTNLIIKYILLILLAISISACGNTAPADERPENTAAIEESESALQIEKPAGEDLPEEPDTLPEEPDTMPEESITEENESMNNVATELKMSIGTAAVTVSWEDNESVDALREMAERSPLSISMSMYGGFEQVGQIGKSLPRNDMQTTTQSGDIVLYSGDQLVVFYGSNSWSYTKLGHITDRSAEEMAELLGNGGVTITISK